MRVTREGARVAVLDLKTPADAGALFKEVDVSDPTAVATAIGEISSEPGRVNILVNNAGIEKRAPFLEIEPVDWQRQIDVNLSGTFYCTQAAAREMRKRGYGRVVNISSVAGLIGPIDLAAYGAAKAGIVGLTRAAALDLADYGITVNAIALVRSKQS